MRKLILLFLISTNCFSMPLINSTYIKPENCKDLITFDQEIQIERCKLMPLKNSKIKCLDNLLIIYRNTKK